MHWWEMVPNENQSHASSKCIYVVRSGISENQNIWLKKKKRKIWHRSCCDEYENIQKPASSLTQALLHFKSK